MFVRSRRPSAQRLSLFGGLLLAAAGCQTVTGLDAIGFRSAPANGSGGAGGEGGAGGGTAGPCGVCDGRCVQNHCCRSGGTLAKWFFPGGRSGGNAVFTQFDGKGNLEAAFANMKSQDVWFFELAADGPVTTPMQTQPLGDEFAGQFTVADFDGDGHADLVSNHYVAKSTPNDRFEFYPGNAKGFDPPILMPNPRYPAAPAAVDFDGDGDLDLWITYNPGSLPAGPAVRFNLGDRTFSPPVLVEPYFQTFKHYGPVRGSFALGGSAVLETKGSASIEIPNGTPAKVQRRTLDVGVVPQNGGIADLDGDGDDDILLVTGSAGAKPKHLLTYLRSGVADVELCEELELPPDVAALDLLVAGDFDFDGHPDMLGIDSFNELFAKDRPEYTQSTYVLVRSVFP